MTEIFNLIIPDHMFIFVTSHSSNRVSVIEGVISGLGAKIIGPHCLSLHKDNAAVSDIKSALNFLEDGECVYVITSKNSALESYLIVPPRANPTG